MADVKVNILEIDGLELDGPTEYELLAADVPVDTSNIDLTSPKLQGAVEELANRHFGKDSDFVQDLGPPISTTSGTYIPFLELPFTVSPATGGIYRFGWNANHISSKSNTKGSIRIVIDSGLPGEIVIEEGNIVYVERIFTGFDAGVLTAGAHTVALEARRDSGNGSVIVDSLRIEVWRVS